MAETTTNTERAASAVPGGDQDWAELVPLAALVAWMDARGLGEGPIEAPRLLPGGTQNILLRFSRAGREYVLRRPPKHLRANSNETMRREARVLAALAGTDVRHPALIAGEPREDVIGAAFYLMEPVEGFCPRDEMPALHAGDPAIRHEMGLADVRRNRGARQGRLARQGAGRARPAGWFPGAPGPALARPAGELPGARGLAGPRRPAGRRRRSGAGWRNTGRRRSSPA